jgi:transcriptional regulator with GAF, ATPase, and Fis domain
VPVNCGAISESLFESELFGHEKGAFTGAVARKDGAFQAAHGGTLFLDEIGELPEASQAKLLRALETGEVRRVGSTSVSHPDVRVVAATNRDLERAVTAGEFRQDLFFRLAVLAIRLPPLRDRIEDLPTLVRVLCTKLGTGVRASPEALEKLKQHPWPGNVRELRNVLTRAFVLDGPAIEASAIRFSPWAFEGPRKAPTAAETALKGPKDALQVAERKLLEEALRRHAGNRSAVARELGLARSTLHYKLARYKLEPRDYT